MSRQPYVLLWDGDRAPNEHALNVLVADGIDDARRTLGRWRNAALDRSLARSIVVALPNDERAKLAISDLDGVAVVFPDGADPVRFVLQILGDGDAAGQSDDSNEPEREAVEARPASGVSDELLRPDYGLGSAKKDWLAALKDHGTDV
jgi:hypothetical protein